ncbi:hypothetical protein [Methylosarcina fibrata]|jgi:hypothetical protein|uniref:hypothetical protein n=1 Tax=Methylosarcina fibrata TaxID=105972 RepID=UPI0003734674|nr:hypothetical protein [Methylosarcina fibrata]
MGRSLGNRKTDAIEKLAKLASGIDGKSEAAKLREVIDSVELALSSGVRREKVLEAISESLGISMSLKTFEKNLYRIRKKRKGNNQEPETNQKGNKGIIRLNIHENNSSVLVTKDSQQEKSINEQANKKFLTPKEIRDMRIKTLREHDEEYDEIKDNEQED